MSPELLLDGTPSRQSDCYALGMVIYEVSLLSRLKAIVPSSINRQVLTGLRPFHQLGPFAVVIIVQKGKRPKKPTGAGSLGFSDTLWGLVFRCWDKSPIARPTAQQLLRCLEGAHHAWVPPPEYPVPDDLDEGTEFEFISDGWNEVTGALARNLLIIIGVFWIFISFWESFTTGRVLLTY